MTNPIADFGRGFMKRWARASAPYSSGEVSAGKDVLTHEHRAAAAAEDPRILGLLADRAEAEAEFMHAAGQLHELLSARGDPELTAAIRRWSEGLTRIVDLGPAVNSAKAGAGK